MEIPSHIQGAEGVIFLETNAQQNSLVIKNSPIWTGRQHSRSIPNLGSWQSVNLKNCLSCLYQKKLA